MATDVTKIKALDDYPPTPYATEIENTSIRVRWIHAQCYQIELPDGKVIMTDPFFPQHPDAFRRENTPDFDVKTLGRVDYITLNHSHVDHNGSIDEIFKQCEPVVICDRIYARELSAVYHLPEFSIFPIVPDMSYEYSSFKLDTVHNRHNNLGDYCDLQGRKFIKPHSLENSGILNSFGCLFNVSYLFTLNNGYRIGFAAGVDVDAMAKAWKNGRPNLLLRQRLVYAQPLEYARDCESIGGQLVMPMHHDASFDWNCDMNAYTNDVNHIFESDGSFMRMFNPERFHWYTISMRIFAE